MKRRKSPPSPIPTLIHAVKNLTVHPRNQIVPFTFETFDHDQWFEFTGHWDTGRNGIPREYLRLKLYRFLEIFVEARDPYTYFGSRSSIAFYDVLSKVTLSGSGSGSDSSFDWLSLASAVAAVQLFLPDELLSSVQVKFTSKKGSRTFGPIFLRVDAIDFETFPQSLYNTRYYYPKEYMPATAGRNLLENVKSQIRRLGTSEVPLTIQKFVEGAGVMLEYRMWNFVPRSRPDTPMTYTDMTAILDYLIGFFVNEQRNHWHPFVYVVYWSQSQQALELRLFNGTGSLMSSSYNQSGNATMIS